LVTGDKGILRVEAPQLKVKTEREVHLPPGELITFRGVDFEFHASEVDLWWPLGMGNQTMYNLVITFEPDAAGATQAPPRRTLLLANGARAAGEQAVSSTVKRRIGFRTVKLHREPLAEAARNLLGQAGGWNSSVDFWPRSRWCKDKWNCKVWGLINESRWDVIEGGPPYQGNRGWWTDDGFGRYSGNPESDTLQYMDGESFYFSVNGVPVYAKGANVIPVNLLSTNTTNEAIEQVMGLAVTSKMNMIRVWGGGLYNPERFYDYADEKGLMIWQETMFACAHYPR
jgi:beta-galactosidase/beta-glucuronidase